MIELTFPTQAAADAGILERHPDAVELTAIGMCLGETEHSLHLAGTVLAWGSELGGSWAVQIFDVDDPELHGRLDEQLGDVADRITDPELYANYGGSRPVDDRIDADLEVMDEWHQVESAAVVQRARAAAPDWPLGVDDLLLAHDDRVELARREVVRREAVRAAYVRQLLEAGTADVVGAETVEAHLATDDSRRTRLRERARAACLPDA